MQDRPALLLAGRFCYLTAHPLIQNMQVHHRDRQHAPTPWPPPPKAAALSQTAYHPPTHCYRPSLFLNVHFCENRRTR